MERESSLAEEVVSRGALLVTALLAFVGSTSVALLIGVLWVYGLPAGAFLVSAVWFWVAIPVLFHMAVVVVDLGIYLATGYVLLTPAFSQYSSREHELRQLAGKAGVKRRRSLARRVRLYAALYTNPLTPFLVGGIKMILTRPALREEVDSLADKLRPNPSSVIRATWTIDRDQVDRLAGLSRR